MWKLTATDRYAARHRRYEKKHSRELQAVLDNLDTYVTTLNEGVNPLQVKFGFVHPEPLGVVAIDQKGGGHSLQETRLYVYPDQPESHLHLITLGDKNTQSDDISDCKQFVTTLRKSQGNDPSNIQQRPGINPPHFGGRGVPETTGGNPAPSRDGKEANGVPSR